MASAPGFAAAAARRAVETRLVHGKPQAGVWDLATGERRIVTGSPHGVDLSGIEPDGRHIWWFGADADGSGLWWRQPFGGGPASPALPGVPRGRPRGVAFDGDGVAAICIGVEDEAAEDPNALVEEADPDDDEAVPPAPTDRTLCYVGRPGEQAREIHAASGYRCLVDVSPDGRHLALAGAPDGPHAAVLLGVDGTVAATLGGGPDARLRALEFRPDRLDAPEMLLMAQTPAEFVVGTWDPAAGLVLRPHLSFRSTASASWCPTPEPTADRTVLVRHETAGGSRLLLADLDRPGTRELPIPDGTVHDVSHTPDGGRLYCLWSRTDTPATLLAIEPGGKAPAVEPVPPPPASAVRDLWTSAPYGAIHSLLTVPDAPPPWPTVFLVHDGPATHDRDRADSRVDVLRDAGCAVVRTNYRGSTGYGSHWRQGFAHRVGLAQAEDLAAVRAHLLAEGLADPGRIALLGSAFGGSLALLALGLGPDLWAAGVAMDPVTDLAEAFAATPPSLRARDVALFGGTPDEVGDRYAAASPITYVNGVRGPLLLVGAADGIGGMAPQLRRYTARLEERGVAHRTVWRKRALDGGHAEEQAAIVGMALEFLRESLGIAEQGAETFGIPTDHDAAA